MTELGGVTMYFGTANGSARKALQKVEEPDIMLSAQSHMGIPWDGIENLFIDSGGYSLMLDTGEHPPASEYLDTVQDYDADTWAVQDYPCEPKILDKYDRSVREHQHMTTVATAECIVEAEERGLDGEPMAVLQGWELDDYLAHIDQLRDEQLLTDRVGIGSVCRRHQADEIRQIIKTVDEELPDRDLHAFGVKNQILTDPETRRVLDSADTSAWYYRNYDQRNAIDDTWQEMISQYLQYRRKLASLAGELKDPKINQNSLDQYP